MSWPGPWSPGGSGGYAPHGRPTPGWIGGGNCCCLPVEESIWGLSAALMVVGMLLARRQLQATRRPLLALSCAAGGPYAAFMFCVDVPMYWSRWEADEALGLVYLTVEQGLRDASVHWVVSHSWDHWRSEVVWMTTYFGVCVWLSISMVLMPKFRPASG